MASALKIGSLPKVWPRVGPLHSGPALIHLLLQPLLLHC